jgi:YegS/Rv2252/BmrU family lipid kinase
MFIVNPIAGGGKAKGLAPLIAENFRKAGALFDLHITSGPGEAVEAARRAATEKFDVVVAVGGDGTVNEVVNGIAGTGAVLAAVHGGKGNDFATATNMPRDFNAACRALLHGRVKVIDLAKVLDRFFINSAGVGFDATVAHRVNQGVRVFKGLSAYIYTVFTTLATYQPVEMDIVLDDHSFTTTPMLVAVGIGPSYGGGMRIVPDAIQDDGLFDICVFGQMNRLALAYHFPKVFKGAHTSLKQTHFYRSREVKLRLSREQPLHMEGEILFGDRMHFTLEPKGMPVLTAP